MTLHRAAAMGIGALSSNPLRTLLSALGVVMGVAALVAVMSIGDGVAAFARQQIAETTDLLGISIVPSTTLTVDGQSVRRNDVVRFTADDAVSLADWVNGEDRLGLTAFGSALVAIEGMAAQRGFGVTATLARHFVDAGIDVMAGRTYRDSDTAVVVLNAAAAAVVAGDATNPASAVGRDVVLNGNPHRVIGVVTGGKQGPAPLGAFVPLADVDRAVTGQPAAFFTILAPSIDQVDRMRREAEAWAAARFGEDWKERLAVRSNRERVEQAATAMHVFRLLMGAIAGVSLLVGGVGIMNVLLAAVAERTREIGIRRAVGARRHDVLVQFLAESVAITSVGTAVGVALGLGIASVTAAVMRQRTGAPVEALVTLATITLAAGLAIMVGIGFGLYPAVRASRLTPLDALRHE